MEEEMRTNIVIDDELIHAAMQVAGTTTKKQTVEAGLRTLLDHHAPTPYAVLRRLAGQVEFSAERDDDEPRWSETDPETMSGDWW
jgi:Arc/MetJ family transcription regulator